MENRICEKNQTLMQMAKDDTQQSNLNSEYLSVTLLLKKKNFLLLFVFITFN